MLDAAKPELYVHSEYHVEAFHDSKIKYSYNNMLRKIRNNLTVALNKFPTVLPDYVIILLGNSYVHDHTFVELELKPILKKMFNDVTRLLSTRREQLPRVLQSFKYTQVFMIRPLPKPAAALKGDQKFKNTRRYLNQMLDNLARTHDVKPLNVDEINCSQRVLFDKKGALSDYGKERLWVLISDFIERNYALIKLSLRKCAQLKQDVGTQVKPDMIIQETVPVQKSGDQQPIDEYFTSGHAWTSGRDRRGHDQWGAHSCRDHFDDFHRRYDRAEHFDNNDHYNY